MITPTFELPDIERRSRWGWVLVLTVLGMLIALANAVYLSQNKYDVLIRSYVTGAEQGGLFGGPQVSKAELKRALAEIEAESNGPRDNVLYSITIRDLLDMEPRPRDLDVLRDREETEAGVLYQIYSDEKLTPKEARDLAEHLDEGGPFALQVAKRRAYEKAGVTEEAPAKPDQQRIQRAGIVTILTMLVGVGIWIVYGVRRSQGKLPVVGLPEGRISLAAGDRHAARAGIMLLSWILIQIALVAVAGTIPEIAMYMIQGITLGLLAVCLIPYIAIGGRTLGASGLGLGKLEPTHILWGLLALPALWATFAVLMPLSLIVFRGLPPPQSPISFEAGGATGLWSIVGVFVSVSLIAPVWEEITFRGLLFPAYTGALRSPAAGIILSSLSFAAIHSTGIPAWPMLAAVGAMCAILYYHTGSLWSAIFLHAFHNAFTLAISLIALG